MDTINAKIKVVKGMVGTVLPSNDDKFSGFHGKQIEKKYKEAGFHVNVGSGPDLPQYNQEIKSMHRGTHSDRTVGSCTLSDFISSNGEKLLDKLQNWRFHEISNSTDEIMSEVNIDWTSDAFQDAFKKDFNTATSKLKKISALPKSNSRIYTGDIFSIESVKDRPGLIRVRIPNSNFKKLKTMAAVEKSLNKHFKFD